MHAEHEHVNAQIELEAVDEQRAVNISTCGRNISQSLAYQLAQQQHTNQQ